MAPPMPPAPPITTAICPDNPFMRVASDPLRGGRYRSYI